MPLAPGWRGSGVVVFNALPTATSLCDRVKKLLVHFIFNHIQDKLLTSQGEFMRLLIAALLLLSAVTGQADCRVYVPEKVFYNSGYTITFDFYKMLNDKKYSEVYTPEEADFVLKLEGIEQEGRLHKAVAVMEMGPYKAQDSVTCFTQLCGISDYGKAFSKVYKKMSALILVCE